MKGVLRIALTYFAVVPLQSWISLIGAVLIALAIAGAVFSSTLPAGSAGVGFVFLFLGASLIGMIPVMTGGGLMRQASNRIILHQRPWGRQRMLLAATLVITLLAAVASLLPLLATLQHGAPHGPRHAPFEGITTFEMFALCWSGIALFWIFSFIVSGSHLLAALSPVSLLLLTRFGKSLAGALPPSAAALAAPVLLAVSIASWCGFSLWYLRVPTIRRLAVLQTQSVQDDFGILPRFLLAHISAAPGTPTRTGAIREHLQMIASPLGNVLIGASLVLLSCLALLVLRSLVLPAGERDISGILAQAIFLPMIMIMWSSVGFKLVRSARKLWLRAGLQRAALFAWAERGGLAAAVQTLGVIVVAFAAFSLVNWPEHARAILLFYAGQLACAACLFYGGLSLTRGWVATDVLLGLGLFAMFVLELIVLGPWNFERSAMAPYALAVLLLLVPALRRLARQRWLALDWRVARLPVEIRQ